MPRLSYDIHNVWGFCTNIFLIAIGLTGAAIVLAHHSPAFAAFLFGSPPKVEPMVVFPNQQPIALSKLLQTADTALPGGETTAVYFAQKPVPSVGFQKIPSRIQTLNP